MKKCWFLILYVLIHTPNDHVAVFEGMPRGQVQKMLTQQGLSFEFISKATYDQFLAAHMPKH